MRRDVLILMSALCASQSPSIAAASSKSPLLGTWALDLNSMSIPAEFRPVSVTLTLADAGQNQWQISYTIVGKDGSVRKTWSRDKLDGTPVAIEGDQIEADSVALSKPAHNVLVMGLSKDGRPGSVRVYTAAADARTMSESAANVGDDGKPFVRSFRWNRVLAGR
jgi:hypothetical protein